MALILELWENRQLDFSIDPEDLCDLLDQMAGDGEITVKYPDDGHNDPTIRISDFPAILEKLKFTLIPEIKQDKILLSLFAPKPIKMTIKQKKENQPHVRSSSSG